MNYNIYTNITRQNTQQEMFDDIRGLTEDVNI